MSVNKLRIIGGKWKGRKISFNQQDPMLRPTLDRIRETLFNWLSPYIVNANCLDLFAGSGIFGFEALSRGAGSVCAVEKNFRSYKLIEDNRKILNLTEQQLTVVHADAFNCLNNWCNDNVNTVKFHLVFLDPPYTDRSLLLNCLNRLIMSDLMINNGKIYVECNKDVDILIDLKFSERIKLYKWNKTSTINFYLFSVGDYSTFHKI